jgi:hypothetical protein
METEENKKSEVKFIVYLDDDDVRKEKHAIIEEDEFWVYIQLYNLDKELIYGEKFKIPKARVLKIKDLKEIDNGNS